MPKACCQAGSSRASILLRLQATISHASVAGSAATLRMATRSSQSAGVTAPNMAPTDITVSTKRTARRITPTWQASKTSARAGRAGATGAGPSWNVDKICESFISSWLWPDYW